MHNDTKELISAFKASRISRKEFCKERNISLSTLQYHLLKHKKKMPQMKDSGFNSHSAGN